MKEYQEKDLKIIAFLLASEGITFTKTSLLGETVFFHFTPYDKALELSNGYFTKTAPKIHAKDLLEAFEQARTILFREKDKSKYGGINYGEKS